MLFRFKVLSVVASMPVCIALAMMMVIGGGIFLGGRIMAQQAEPLTLQQSGFVALNTAMPVGQTQRLIRDIQDLRSETQQLLGSTVQDISVYNLLHYNQESPLTFLGPARDPFAGIVRPMASQLGELPSAKVVIPPEEDRPLKVSMVSAEQISS